MALIEDGSPVPPGVNVVARVIGESDFRSIVANAGHGIAMSGDLPEATNVALTLNFHDAGALLGSVSEKTIRRLVAKGELPVIDVGGQRRIAREDLDRFIATHRRDNTGGYGVKVTATEPRSKRGSHSYPDDPTCANTPSEKTAC